MLEKFLGPLEHNQFLFALFEHWDGASWKTMTGNFYGFFTGVSADATNDIWAVGCGNGVKPAASTLI